MNTTPKQIVAVVLIGIVLAVAVYGSYLPMRKAQMFIAALQSLQSQPATSLSELESRISGPLDYPSPIGQEELVRNMANSVLSFVQRGSDASSTAELISFLHTYYDPIIDRGTGMSFGQDLYLFGAINEIAFARLGNPKYLEGAKAYYSKANELGPNRPQPLYGLFDVYRTMGDVTNTQAVVNKILTNWPGDQGIRAAFAQFLAAAAKFPKASGK